MVRTTFYARHGKRLLDLLVVAASAPLLLPLFGLIALGVKITSRGPIFYRQTRCGLDGRPFHLLKFRSMVAGAEAMGAGVRVERDDPRITLFGRALRRLSLDELPQLINVLSGQMSLVGPRPGLPYQVEQYNETQRRRLQVRPGLTGWAQVNGRNLIDWAERIRLDIDYIERFSLGLDLRILARSIPAVLGGGSRIALKEYWRRPEPAPRRPPPDEREKDRSGEPGQS